MITYILNLFIALSLFWTFYKLVLEKEKCFNFNRFYLIITPLSSILIPLFSLKFIRNNSANLDSANLDLLESIQYVTTFKSNLNFITETDYSFFWFILYFFGLIIFTTKLIVNVKKLLKIAKYNPSIELSNAKIILVNENIANHSFLKFIFVNKIEYTNNKIQKEIIEHELVHVNQKHSWDIIYIESLKIIFWFLPMFQLFKKALQINHEFIADQEVILKNNDLLNYQKILLNSSNYNLKTNLTSHLNYLLTKKRLIMMTKLKSNSKIFIKTTLTLPLFGVVLLFSCNDKNISKNTINIKDADLEVVAYGEEADLKEPEFPGGKQEFVKYVLTNYQPTEKDLKNKNLELRFTVKQDGSLSNINIINVSGDDDEEKLRKILKNSKKWIPGTLNNEKVLFRQNIVLF